MTTPWDRLSLSQYLSALGSSSPTPGGGSAAALAGALASALGRMVVAVSHEKEPTAQRAELLAAFTHLEGQFLDLAAEDELAFAHVMEALRMPRDAAGRRERLETACAAAADVPLRTARTAISLLERLSEAESHASRAIVSDVGAAALLAHAAAHSSVLNVQANLASIKDPRIAERLLRAADDARTAADDAQAAVLNRVQKRLVPRTPSNDAS